MTAIPNRQFLEQASPYIGADTIEEVTVCYNDLKKIFQIAVEKGIVRPLPPMLLLHLYTANALTVANFYHSSISTFLWKTSQILNELENAAWNMIAAKNK